MGRQSRTGRGRLFSVLSVGMLASFVITVMTACTSSFPSGTQVFRVVSQPEAMIEASEGVHLARNQTELDQIFTDYSVSGEAPSDVDFTKDVAIVVIGCERPSTAWSLSATEVTAADSGRIVVNLVEETLPTGGGLGIIRPMVVLAVTLSPSPSNLASNQIVARIDGTDLTCEAR